MQPTREEILNEPAGPRLNAWVAEWVMGWKKDNRDGLFWICEDGEIHIHHWDPSQNIAHAWEVVEKMQDLQKGVEFRNAWRKITLFDFTQFTAKTMSALICYAALLAKLDKE